LHDEDGHNFPNASVPRGVACLPDDELGRLRYCLGDPRASDAAPPDNRFGTFWVSGLQFGNVAASTPTTGLTARAASPAGPRGHTGAKADGEVPS
jgi:hypothetical protein